MLVQKWREARGDGEDKEIRADDLSAPSTPARACATRRTSSGLRRLVSRPAVRSTKSGAPTSSQARAAELDEIIDEEGLKPDETGRSSSTAFRDGAIQTTGTAITRVLPPVSRVLGRRWPRREEAASARTLGVFFERFFGLGTSGLGIDE